MKITYITLSKPIFPIFLFTILYSTSFSQTKASGTATVSGKVIDDKKQPVGFVSVIIEGTKSGVQADSLGNFTLPVKPNSNLIFSKTGYDKISVIVINDTLLNIVLKTQIKTLKNVLVNNSTIADSKAGIDRNNDINRQMAITTINFYRTAQNLSYGPATLAGGGGGELNYKATGTWNTGSLLPVFSTKEETKGSRYLFDKWVKGAAVDANGNFITNDSFSFNYDKIAHKLLLTKDETNALEIDYESMQSFTLTDGVNEYSFVRDPRNDKKSFLQILNYVAGKYCLYKEIKTHFEKSDYKSTGMVESGNKYDEFVDEKEYLVYNNNDKQAQKITFKKSSITEVLFKDTPLVKKYFSDHKEEEIDEKFLQGLIDFINKSSSQ